VGLAVVDVPHQKAMDFMGKALDWVYRQWAVIAAVVGWAAAACEWIRKRRAEARLKEIRRRAEAPFLVPTSFTAHSIADPVRFVDMRNHGDMLEKFSVLLGTHGVEMRQGFSNEGQKVRAVSIVQPSLVSLVNVGTVIPEGPSAGWLRYVYDHSKKGQPERFSIQFESLMGVRQIHVYEVIHGVRSLQRVDPA